MSVKGSTPDISEDCSDKSFQKTVTLQKNYGKTGALKTDDGTFYIGDLDETGVRVGLGHLEIPNGSTYDGSFSKGLPNGIGIMTFPDSSRYEGEFMQGWFHGHGVFSTIDGMKFEGEFRGGRIWGNGLLTYSDGSPSSEGYFQESRFREEGCKENIKRARRIAMLARRCSDEFKGTCDVDFSIKEKGKKKTQDL
eukprot:TRINITY_DN62117_c0_g1_i1.p1 TRINITY_DN62117_c0_g1~~TRINITY_DN62117_c0_g1_i1.p1  ORF type:complete len:194 (-),score=48.50 TRINITY_DN62117_c0_g1_i1:263-844(-)